MKTVPVKTVLLKTALPVCWLLLIGCSPEDTFTVGHDLNICTEDIPAACGAIGHCDLDSNQYLSGTFPGANQFIVRTDGPTTIDFQMLLTNEEGAGTDLLLTVHEPNCSDVYSFDSAGRDIFGLTDSEGVIDMPISVQLAGDHLVEFVSDAYCSYDFLYNVNGS